ncbi:lycopene cyclase family protein [Nocardia iowensis]|uniref:Lycopene cyclase n=1 Tax=Nocardia iowensis TaxID=204891 RepID=A0ABX8S5A0_NOCIO|nr:lycopene cyclase family protein [Nocardia iowensis]QXN95790.1 lycopene cyclase [Nocardia iowensis]
MAVRDSPGGGSADVIVCGLGPAGRALAHRCLARGLSVTAVDPVPDRLWSATYAAWGDELPGWLDPAAIAATVEQPMAWGTRAHRIDRRYVVFDTARLQTSLKLAGAEVIADRAVQLTPETVTLASGRTLTAQRVIDARGIARSPALAEQTAYGLVLDERQCAGIEPLFMDWRTDNGAPADAPRSFLYAVPLGGGAMLLEETCLVGRPALDGTALRDRLHHRLRSRGIEFTGDERIERVRFPVEGGRPGRHTFGAAGGFAHPATGYSVAASLAAADMVAAGTPAWPISARAVYRLRAAGLRALLALPPADVPVFFDAFFALPADSQRAYLSGRTDLSGTVTAMRRLFTTLPPPLRRRVAAATLWIPIRSRIRMPSAIMEV